MRTHGWCMDHIDTYEDYYEFMVAAEVSIPQLDTVHHISWYQCWNATRYRTAGRVLRLTQLSQSFEYAYSFLVFIDAVHITKTDAVNHRYQENISLVHCWIVCYMLLKLLLHVKWFFIITTLFVNYWTRVYNKTLYKEKATKRETILLISWLKYREHFRNSSICTIYTYIAWYNTQKREKINISHSI